MDCCGKFFTHSNLWCNPCAKCYAMGCFGTYFTHVQTCDVTRVQSATEWTAAVHTLHIPNLWCNPCSKCYGMDCFGTYFTHAKHVRKLDLRKTATRMQPIPQRNEKLLKKQTPFSGAKKYGHVTIPCKQQCFSDLFFLPIVIAQIFWNFSNCNITKPWEFHVFLFFTSDVFVSKSCTYTRGKQSAG